MIKQEVKEVIEKEVIEKEERQTPQAAMYCNGVSVSRGLFDFELELKQNSSGVDQTLGTIIMSPQHIKALAELLMQNIEKYEDQYGPIPTRSK
ncbi:DUF3467 domain-containing protein [Bacillus cereus]